MARRRISTPEDAAGATPEELAQASGKGTTFINNILNRHFTTKSGKKFAFTRSLQTFTDPEEIETLTELSKNTASHKIFLVPPDPADEPATPVEPAPMETDEPVSQS